MIRPLLFLFALTAFASAASAQSAIVGTVKAADETPVPGATVQVKGTNLYTLTDATGQFNLAAPKEFPFTLRISFASYQTKEIQIYDVSDEPLDITLENEQFLSEVVVTARRRNEAAQEVPIPISIVGGATIEQSGAFNVNRVKELIPSVQLYTSNPRNTGINIRGLGSPFGLTNDGLDPGVGFYVDGVYYARPAAATLDFIDVEQIEVLRGPQGTLFGKNTTAGAFNITTRKASFTPGAAFEASYGNYGYIQAKASVTGPLSKKFAARVSFSGTQRDGVIENVATGRYTNDINNIGGRVQLLYQPTKATTVTLSGDITQQRPDGYAQVVAGVAPTRRSALRQFSSIIADLNYTLPSDNAFDRKIDQDTPWRSNNDLGGATLNIDSKIGPGTFTSTTAYRYWDWNPSNDRDFTGLQVLAKSQNPSKHHNWSQEFRYAAQLSERLSGVAGLFYLNQEVTVDGTEESGNAQWRFAQSSNSPLWRTPGLFEGYGIRTNSSIKSTSAAFFANVDWAVTEKLHILPGVRLNYDKKDVVYDRKAYGGLDTATYAGSKAEKIALQGFKNGVYASQDYTADADETNFTYQLTLAYQASKRINAFATYSTSYKPVGVNVAGLPGNDKPAVELAVIKPEYVKHFEIGVKTTPADNFILNLVVHNTDIDDYQTNVQSPEVGVNRGYIANAEKVNVRGVELDANIKANSHFSFYGSAAYTEGTYERFPNAPLPLEETGLTVDNQVIAFKDISGSDLPGISKWCTSIGGEFTTPVKFLRQPGTFFLALDTYYRSEFSSASTPSPYLVVDGYSILNARVGFRVTSGTSFFLWGRNLANTDYYEQLLIAGGNAGQYAGVLGDPRTYGVTLRHTF